MLKRVFTTQRILIGAYLSLAAFLLAHTVSAFVADALRPQPIATRVPDAIEPKTHSESSRTLVDAIVTRALFPLPPDATISLDSNPASETPAPPLDAAKKVALLGTVFGPQGGMMAVLEDVSTKRQSLYRLGQPIPALGALSAIERDRVLFREGKQEEWLGLALTQQLRSPTETSADVTRPHKPSSPQRRILDRREIEAVLSDTTRLLTHAQAVPFLVDGKLDGFRLYSVMPLGFFDKIGLQTNDVLQRINGVEIRDPGMLLSLFQQLRHERTIRVDIVRNSQRQSLAYEIR